MSALDPVSIVSLGLVTLGVALGVMIAFVRAMRVRRRARRRIVERPNSYYTSKLVQENETRHRWHDIALDRIHEINREEVVRLLARVEAAGVEVLRPNERAFLDHMAKLAGRTPPTEPREKDRPPAPDLRHRPA
ncbi:MAG TPA: hypothetical protein VF188_04105 [Longimicrobiales bacterium]